MLDSVEKIHHSKVVKCFYHEAVRFFSSLLEGNSIVASSRDKEGKNKKKRQYNPVF